MLYPHSKGGPFLGSDCRGLGEWSVFCLPLYFVSSRASQVSPRQEAFNQQSLHMEQSPNFDLPMNHSVKNFLSQKLHQNPISVATGRLLII